MTPAQECLRDKLKKSGDLFKEIEGLQAYIRENEKIYAGTHDQGIKALIKNQNIKLEQDYNNLMDMRLKIDKCINLLDDDELKAILTMRYLGHVNTLDIAEAMHYGRNSINRKHKIALNKIIEKGGESILDY